MGWWWWLDGYKTVYAYEFYIYLTGITKTWMMVAGDWVQAPTLKLPCKTPEVGTGGCTA